MNAVYKLIFNVSTGTWAVAHEFAAARGKKSRSRLAAAMAVALALPAGAALAADSPESLQCAVNESISADGLRCEAAASMAPSSAALPAGAGISAIPDDYIGHGGGSDGSSIADASGVASLAVGANTRAAGNYSVAIGGATGSDVNGPRGAFAAGASSVAIGVVSEARADNSVALGANSLADRANTVSVGAVNNRDGRSFTRQIVNVGAGTQDNDAVNVSQLKPVVAGLGGGAAVNADGTITAPTYNIGGISYNNVGSALTNMDGRVSTIGAALATTVDDKYVKVGQGQNPANEADNTGRAGNIAIGSNARSLGVSSNSATVALGEDTLANNTGSIAIGTTAQATGVGSVAMGLRASATAAGAIALGQDSVADGANTVSLGNASVKRRVVNMAAGTADTDAVNVSQLKPVVDGLGGGASINPTTGVVTGPTYTIGGINYTNVGGALTNLDGRVSTIESSGPGLVERNATTGEITVANKAVGGDVNLRDANGDTRTLTGIKAGTIRTDAVNFGQLTDTAGSVAAALGGGSTVDAAGTITAPTYSIGGGNYRNVGDAFGAVDTSLTTINNKVDGIADGTVGLVTYDDASGIVKVASEKGGTTVDFAGVNASGAAVDRKLTSVAAGELAVDSTDAVNGSQLFATNENVAQNTTNISNLDGRVTVNEGNITNINTRLDGIADGTVGLVTYDDATGVVGVAGSKGGTTVDFAGVNASGAAVDRKLTSVAAGELAVDSTDAVNGSQLFATNENVAQNTTNISNLDGRVTVNEGNITTINTRLDGLADGTAGLVTYDDATGVVGVAGSKGGSTVDFTGTAGARKVTGVAEGEVAAGSEDAVNGSQLAATNDRVAATETNITNLDGRVTTNEGDITNLTSVVNDLSSGAAGLVTIDGTTGNVNVAAGKAGSAVDFTGTDGERRLTGVANGTADSDAVTVAQLKSSGLVDPNDGRALNALVYDDASLGRATLGGTGGTVIGNLANGLIAAGSKEAINGGQLWQINADWESRFNGLDGRVGAIEAGGGSGGGGGDGGGDSGLVSEGTGAGSVVVGNGGSASGDGSVAIGSGSVADRDGEVSMGSAGNERIVSNVAAGVRPTDAVNLQQMDDRFKAEREYTDGRFHSMDKRIDRMGAISAAYAGMAINTAGLSGENRVGAGIGQQNGRSALAVGYQRVMGVKQNVSVSLGGAFSGSDKSISGGAGFSW
ncbi:ESPR-type extended signal peptide-containing protein [Stenotrophomonas tumulicola]|uniref:YadA-like family protein n=1 Tax=Stenotrophomonas tumulicola TaxID=1685415 RepID=A0A7W3FLT8_9GAMM|nr:ESPR-type extended signal peptide-containing protein [Stenotrophomonas tumulicola]MBA8681582.1 YadA-like family protein [Stenotrophomonas tumulicola]